MGNKAVSRLFTFGCSFTRFFWPTWADILAYELKIPHQNWGIPGLGNVGVQSRLLECDLRNKFNEDDIILAVWSSWSREDRFDIKNSLLLKQSWSTGGGTLNHRWSAGGGTMHSYTKNFNGAYCSVSNDLIKNSTAMISVNKMFDIRFNGHIVTPMIKDDKALAFTDKEKELALFYEDYIPNDGEFTRTKHTCSYALVNERHPDIMSHLSYVNEYICPKLNISLSDETIDFFTRIHNALSDFIKTTTSQNYNTEKYNIPWYPIIAKFMSMHSWHDVLKKEGF
jgi:hypothetical protein